MGRFVKGDVIVLPFPFSDLSASKKRPALVIAPLEAHDDLSSAKVDEVVKEIVRIIS